MFEINTSNFPKYKFLCKNRNSQVWNQRCLILVFLDWNLKKTIAKIWNQHPQTCQHAKICRKNKLQIWNQKGLVWVFFNFLINFFINFESHCYISNHHTRNCQNTKFRPTIFFLNLGPTMPDLSVFRMQFWETIVTFEIRTLDSVKIQNVCE